MTYRLIALDLDGTLLNSQLQIREDSMAAIWQAKALGIKVVIVTGRHHTAARYYWHQLKIDTPAICCNGAYIFDFESNVIMPGGSHLTKREVREVLALSRKMHISTLVYTSEHINYEVGGNKKFYLLEWAETLPMPLRPQIRAVSDLAEVIVEPPVIWKLISYSDDCGLLEEFTSEIRESWGLSCERSGKKHLDIMSSDINKALRLADLIECFGISSDEVIAIGDQQNDIQMLKMAGLGIAMGNAIDPLKSCADWVTADNDAGGVAMALQRFALEC